METAQSFSLLAAKVRGQTAGDERMPNWELFFDALKRERTSEEISDRTTLATLSQLLWEAHTAQESIRPETGS